MNIPKINELDKIFQLVNRNNTHTHTHTHIYIYIYIYIYIKEFVAPSNTASPVANNLQTNTKFFPCAMSTLIAVYCIY